MSLLPPDIDEKLAAGLRPVLNVSMTLEGALIGWASSPAAARDIFIAYYSERGETWDGEVGQLPYIFAGNRSLDCYVDIGGAVDFRQE